MKKVQRTSWVSLKKKLKNFRKLPCGHCGKFRVMAQSTIMRSTRNVYEKINELCMKGLKRIADSIRENLKRTVVLENFLLQDPKTLWDDLKLTARVQQTSCGRSQELL